MKRATFVSMCLFAAISPLPGCRDIALSPPGSCSEILLVMEDGAHSRYFESVMKGIGRELDFYTAQEKQFDVTVIPAAELSSDPMMKNTLLVGVMDQSTGLGRHIGTLIGEDGLRELAAGEGAILRRENVPAPGLTTLIVTARSEAELEKVIEKRGGELPDTLEASCRGRMRRFMRDYLDADIGRRVFRTYGFALEIPRFYTLQSESRRPPGVEFLREDPARSLGIFWADWNHEPGLGDRAVLFNLRADYVYERYDGDAMDSTRVSFSRTRLGPYEAVEMTGYWYSTTATAGGCYKTFFVYEEKEKLLWAIDALVYAPGRPKNPLFRELVSIAETFRYD